MSESTVVVKTTFVGFHHWAGAPEEHKYLRNPHRHEFHVYAYVSVSKDDREIEFIDVKTHLTQYLRSKFEAKHNNEENSMQYSCETIARMIIEGFFVPNYGNRLYQVTVLEDGENGGTVTEDYRFKPTVNGAVGRCIIVKTKTSPVLWEGKELEGELKGKWSLFVRGGQEARALQIVRSLSDDKLMRYRAIYFGAGSVNPKIDTELVLNFLRDMHKLKHITIEVGSDIEESELDHLICVANDLHDGKHPVKLCVAARFRNLVLPEDVCIGGVEISAKLVFGNSTMLDQTRGMDVKAYDDFDGPYTSDTVLDPEEK